MEENQILEEILKQIEDKIEKPFITPRFGDNWKKYAMENFDIDTITNIAWKQGRKAILLEDAIRKILIETKPHQHK